MTTVARRAARLEFVLLLVLAGVAASCHSSSKPVAFAKPQAGVTHVVLCWLKTPGDDVARRRIVEASERFIAIPGVVSVMAGTALPSPRPAVDSSYDVGVVMTFTGEAALRAFEQHPTHQRAVEEVLKPLVGKLLIYDIVGGEGKAPAR